ncbi:hypothetical protein SAMN05660330_04139 [Desulforhopalus singaporensis]|uniref:Uncharacterized protein n=1 Tax=Desulforhopalus singaporensis TaxID=91360 RepID=A0A1H0VM84_9BACT|nr:hypothetical protein SAMN05660330_04139 [Desulforhopalus singaporensis]
MEPWCKEGIQRTLRTGFLQWSYKDCNAEKIGSGASKVPVAPNLLDRQLAVFQASDTTCIWTMKADGCSMSNRLTKALALIFLQMAIWRLQAWGDLSSGSWQSVSNANGCQKLLLENQMKKSMIREVDC